MISETQAVKRVVKKYKNGRRPNKLRSTSSRVTGKNKKYQPGYGHSVDLEGFAMKMINETAPRPMGHTRAPPPPYDTPHHPFASRRLKARIGKKLAQPFRRKPRRKAKAAGKNNVRPSRGMRR